MFTSQLEGKKEGKKREKKHPPGHQTSSVCVSYIYSVYFGVIKSWLSFCDYCVVPGPQEDHKWS